MVDETIEWSLGPDTSRTARFGMFWLVGFFGGLAVLVVSFGGWIAFSAVTTDEGAGIETVALVVLALVVAAVIHNRAIVYLFSTDASTFQGFRSFTETTRLVWLVVAAVVGAAIHVATMRLAFGLWAAWFLGGIVGAPVGISLTTTRGSLDPETRTFTFNEKSIELDALDGFRRISLGEVTLLWLSYESSAGTFSLPRLVSIPTSVTDDVLPEFETGVVNAVQDEQRELNPLATKILVGLGLGLVGSGVGLTILVQRAGDELFFALYIGAMIGFFGILMLWVAFTRR